MVPRIKQDGTIPPLTKPEGRVTMRTHTHTHTKKTVADPEKIMPLLLKMTFIVLGKGASFETHIKKEPNRPCFSPQNDSTAH